MKLIRFNSLIFLHSRIPVIIFSYDPFHSFLSKRRIVTLIRPNTSYKRPKSPVVKSFSVSSGLGCNNNNNRNNAPFSFVLNAVNAINPNLVASKVEGLLYPDSPYRCHISVLSMADNTILIPTFEDFSFYLGYDTKWSDKLIIYGLIPALKNSLIEPGSAKVRFRFSIGSRLPGDVSLISPLSFSDYDKVYSEDDNNNNLFSSELYMSGLEAVDSNGLSKAFALYPPRRYFLSVLVLDAKYANSLIISRDLCLLSNVFFTFTLGSEGCMPRLAKIFADLIEGCKITPRDVNIYISFWEDDGSDNPDEVQDILGVDGPKWMGHEGVLCSVKKYSVHQNGKLKRSSGNKFKTQRKDVIIPMFLVYQNYLVTLFLVSTFLVKASPYIYTFLYIRLTLWILLLKYVIVFL